MKPIQSTLQTRILRNCLPTLLILAFGCSQAGEDVAIGPYVQNVSHERATICWSTPKGEAALKGPDYSETRREYEHHSVTFAHLDPSNTYEYSIPGAEGRKAKGSFKTFPEENEPFRFAVLGDTRSRDDIHKSLVGKIIEEKPLFVINTGDLVSDGMDMEQWETFFDINKELMRSVPYYPALGNHENDSPYYYEFFQLPGNERYYTFNVGDAFFLFLDTQGEAYETPKYIPPEKWSEYWTYRNRPYIEQQRAWAERILKLHQDAGYLFAVFHEPMFSAKASRVEESKLRRALWDDVLEKSGVQVAFCGHDHHYHHALNGPTHHLVTGGGGAGLYDADAPQPETVKTNKIEHYIRIDVGYPETKLTAIDINGETIDELVVKHRHPERLETADPKATAK